MRIFSHRGRWGWSVAISLFWGLTSGCASYTGFENAWKIQDKEMKKIEALAPYPKILPRVEASLPLTLQGKAGSKDEVHLNLQEALDLTLHNNKGWLTQVEGLALQGVDVQVAIHNYFPLLTPLVLNYQKNFIKTSQPQSQSASLSSGVNQALPFGGSLGLTQTETASQTYGVGSPASTIYSTPLSASLQVPLYQDSWFLPLQRAGFLKYYDPLISAKRGYVYAQRDVAFAKQFLLISTLTSYFTLLSQKKQIQNFERNVKNAEMGLKQARILFGFGKRTKMDVFQAETNVAQAQNSLSAARSGLKTAEDIFKINLGLNPKVKLILKNEKIVYHPLSLSLDQLVESALEKNPTWQNATDQFEDAKRETLLSLQGTGSSLNLNVGYNRTFSESQPIDQFLGLPSSYKDSTKPSWFWGLSYTTPLDRLTLKDNIQHQVYQLLRQKRDLELAHDQFVQKIRAEYFALKQAEFNLQSLKQQVETSGRAFKLVMYHFRKGDETNQNVITQQETLINAQNNYEQATVDLKVAMLHLEQDAGLLTLDPQGEWYKE